MHIFPVKKQIPTTSPSQHQPSPSPLQACLCPPPPHCPRGHQPHPSPGLGSSGREKGTRQDKVREAAGPKSCVLSRPPNIPPLLHPPLPQKHQEGLRAQTLCPSGPNLASFNPINTPGRVKGPPGATCQGEQQPRLVGTACSTPQHPTTSLRTPQHRSSSRTRPSRAAFHSHPPAPLLQAPPEQEKPGGTPPGCCCSSVGCRRAATGTVTCTCSPPRAPSHPKPPSEGDRPPRKGGKKKKALKERSAPLTWLSIIIVPRTP